MKQMYAIGIDVSKSKLDCAVISFDFEVIEEKEIVNSEKEISSFIDEILKRLEVEISEVLICCENTGIYNHPLERICCQKSAQLWVEHALKIKRASTDMRGKNDKKDALRIAEYAIRYQDKQVLYKKAKQEVKTLNDLLKIRGTLLNQQVAIQNQLKEARSHDPESYKILKSGYDKVLKCLKKSLQETEQQINEVIAKDQQIQQNVELMSSIPGIGMQNAINFIIATNNFESFNSAKHLACYAGVVPFQNQSGTIIKRDRVSKMANKNLKKLLHMAAMAAVRFDPELKLYYQRKVMEGKNKMSVINAVRNKLVHRIMAVITRKSPYEKKFQVSDNLETNLLAF